MPAQFFDATDDKPTGTDLAYRTFIRFMARNAIAMSPAISTRVDIQAAIGEIWDALGGDIPTFRADVTGPLNTDASDLEIAYLTWFVLQQKFKQHGTTLPGGGGP